MPVLLAIALGGVLGSLARFAVGIAMGADEAGWPWATLAVNLIGCLAIGLLATAPFLAQRPLLRPFLITGVLGGFTTVSAFSTETGLLLDSGRWLAAASYVLVTLGAGLSVLAVGRRWASA